MTVLFFKEYYALLLVLVALGLGAYNTYLIKSLPLGAPLPGTVAAKKMTSKEVEKIIKNGAPTLGNPDAKVTVVEFADFQCPFCGKYFENVIPAIKQEFIDTGKARFVFVNLAFLGQESRDAAEAGKCAQDQGKFWEYHDYLYTHQQGENRGAFAVDNLKKFAVELNLDSEQFNQCLDSNKYEKMIIEEANMGKDFGARGTPATFINEFFINGLQDKSYYADKIRAALK